MDLETENRIAAMLMREAAELRRRAEKEGVRAYLEKPTARVRPNSRFLTATVLGVQQANRVVEVNEMWRVRQKETDLDERLSGGSKGEKNNRNTSESHKSASKRLAVHYDDARPSCSSSNRVSGSSSSNVIEDDGGLKDEEIEEFLQSRAKRGRGAVGSRMDETGPYRPSGEDTMDGLPTSTVQSRRTVLGPEKPSSLKSSESSEDESDEDRRKKARKTKSERKHSTKEKLKDKKRKRKEEKRRKKHR